MVEGDGDVSEPADDQLPVANGGPLGDPVEAEDADLGMVDERRDHEAGELARARDAEGRAAELLGLQRAGARCIGQPRHVLGELVHGARIAAAHDRDDEALLGLDGDAEVVPVEQHDLVPLEPGVELGHLLERQGGGAKRERDEATQVEPRQVALLDPRDGRDLAVRPREVVGDEAADAAERDAAALARGRRALWL